MTRLWINRKGRANQNRSAHSKSSRHMPHVPNLLAVFIDFLTTHPSTTRSPQSTHFPVPHDALDRLFFKILSGLL